MYWRVVLRFAETILGAQYVMMDGIFIVRRLFAGNWDFPLKVSLKHAMYIK